MPITSPVERISGPEQRVDAGAVRPAEPVERHHRLLDRDRRAGRQRRRRPRRPAAGPRPAVRRWWRPVMIRAAALASGTAVALDENGTVRDARGLASSTYSVWSLSAYCTFSRPRTPTAQRDRLGVRPDRGDVAAAQGDRRQHAGRVAGVDAGLLDVLHHAAEVDLGAVAQRVDVDLDRVVEEPVDQHRVVVGDLGGPVDVVGQRRARRRRSPCRGRRARRTAGPAPGSRSGSATARACSNEVAMPKAGAGSPAAVSRSPNRPRSSARSMASGEVPRIGHPGSRSSSCGQLQRGLPAEGRR